MTHTLDNTNKARFIADLTEDELESILENLVDNPVDTVVFDREGASGTLYFGVLELGGRFISISCDDSDPSDMDLTYGEVFETEEEAEAGAMEWSQKTKMRLEDEHDRLVNEEWNGIPDASKDLVGPFTFQDNTNYPNGHEMEDLEEIFSFFDRDETLFEPENWGNQYSCSLLDANGTAFWVTRNGEGAMKAYKA